MSSSQVVRYEVDNQTTVAVEINPTPGFQPAGYEEVAGRLSEAMGPAVAAARLVIEEVRKAAPEEVEVTFGVKVTGTSDWLVAKTSAEGNFEVTLRWRSPLS